MKNTFKIANEHANELIEAIDLHDIEQPVSITEGEFNTRFVFEDLADEEVQQIERLIDNIQSR